MVGEARPHGTGRAARSLGSVPDTVPSPLALSRATVDRSGLDRRDPDAVPRALADASTRVLDLFGDRAAYDGDEDQPQLRLRSPRPQDEGRLTLLLGREEQGVVLAVVHPPEDDGGEQRATLRRLGLVLDDRDTGLLTSAVGLANWHAGHGFCPRCGGRTQITGAGWTRTCSDCGANQFPRTDPAVIMAVTDPDERLLLARGPQWAPGRLSVLAGFVEPGESLEAAVAREVNEEVSIEVTDVCYQANQPWPFPASLMLGFSARTTDTMLHPDPVEIAEARWLSRDDVAQQVAGGTLAVASRLSIARFLIEQWYGGPVDGS